MKTNFLNKKLLCGIILLLFVILFAFLITDGYFNLDRDVKIYSADAIDIINQRMTSLLFEMNIFPQYIGNDLLFLSRLSSLKKVVNSEGGRDNVIKDLKGDFLEFLKGSTAYYQLRYIDENGDEIVRIEFDGNNYKTVPEDKLQNKANRYYFTETIDLAKGEIYLSPLDLNIENGIIENRGTEENPIYIPIMRATTPVFDMQGNKKGIILFNIYTDYFLDDIRRSQRQGETVFLINKEGYYLAHSDREKEFAFMFDRDDNFYNDYPEISRETLLSFDERRFESDDLIFSFKYIHPTVGNVGIHRGSEKILGEKPEEQYYWILVSISDKNGINDTIKELRSEYIYFLLFSGLIALIIVFLIFIAVFRGFDNKDFRGKR